MKCIVAFVVSVVVLTSTVVASEEFNEEKPLLLLPELELVFGQPITFTAVMEPGKPAGGFRFNGVYWDDFAGGDTWWASDLRMTITTPGGQEWTAGGWDSPNDENWNGWPGSGAGGQGFGDGLFEGPNPVSKPPNDGPNFDDDGNQTGKKLSAMHWPWKDDPKEKEGVWTITFEGDFSGADGPMLWTDVEVWLLNVPAPGALALLGLAGLAGTRRRRLP